MCNVYVILIISLIKLVVTSIKIIITVGFNSLHPRDLYYANHNDEICILQVILAAQSPVLETHFMKAERDMNAIVAQRRQRCLELETAGERGAVRDLEGKGRHDRFFS